MWFKNIRLFRLDAAFKYTADELDKMLASQRFVPCSGQDLQRMGWISVLGQDSESLCHNIGDDWFFRCRIEKKMLPASVITDELNEKVFSIMIQQPPRSTLLHYTTLYRSTITI